MWLCMAFEGREYKIKKVKKDFASLNVVNCGFCKYMYTLGEACNHLLLANWLIHQSSYLSTISFWLYHKMHYTFDD